MRSCQTTIGLGFHPAETFQITAVMLGSWDVTFHLYPELARFGFNIPSFLRAFVWMVAEKMLPGH